MRFFQIVKKWIRENWSTAIIFFFVGIVVGWFFSMSPRILEMQFQPWQVKREIGISDAITLFSALIITYLLTMHAQRQIGVDRAEKDQLMGLCDDAHDCLNVSHFFFREIIRSAEITQDDYHQLTSNNQEVSKAVTDVMVQLADNEYYDIETNGIDQAYRRYSEALVNEDIEKLVLTPNASSNELFKRNSLAREIRTLKFKINKR